MRGSHLTSKVTNECLNFRERMEVVERNKDGPLHSPTILWIVSVCVKGNPDGTEKLRKFKIF